MAGRAIHTVLDHLRRLHGVAQAAQRCDRELLHTFVKHNDQDAFAVVVSRHAPLVWGVCRRILGHHQDAEDTFQATFLILARRAGSVRWQTSVGGWLHTVAQRLAVRARKQAEQRRIQECEASRIASGESSLRDLAALLDEELRLLPAKYREPLLLHYLEGATAEAAALQLGLSRSAFYKRLTRGRELLRERLSCQGLSLAAPLLAAALSGETEAASRTLIQSTIRVAMGSAPERVAALATEALGATTMIKLKIGLTLGLLLGVAAGGVAMLTPRGPMSPLPQAERPAEPPKTEDKAAVRVDRYGDPLPPRAVARLGTTRFRNGRFKPHFFPDGQTILTANRHGLQFWETATGRLRREIPIEPLYAWRTALSPDGKQVAVTGFLMDKSPWQAALRVWDVATGKEVRTFTDKERKVVQTFLTFTPDGKQLVSMPGGTLCFEDVASGKATLRKQFSTDIFPTFALSPNGETLAIEPGVNTWKFYLWNWKAEEEPREIKIPRRPFRGLCFSPDGKVLAGFGEAESTITLTDVRSGRVARSINMDKENVTASDLAFSPDSKVLAVADSGNSNRKNFSGGLYFWDLERDRYLHKLLTPGEQVLFTNFSRDGRWVAATTSRGVHVWEMPTGRAVAESLDAHCASLTRIAVSSRGLTATASNDHTVRIWDTVTGRQRWKLQHDQPVENVVLTPDGRSVVTATGMDNTIRFWDINTGKEIKRLPGQKRFATNRALSLTPDGRRLLSWADNRSLRIWDVVTGKVLREHTIPPGDTGKSDIEKDRRRELLAVGMGACCFTPDGAYFILSLRGEFRVYETASGKQWQTIPNSGGRVNSLVVSADGRAFLAGTEGNGEPSKKHTVSLWELATAKLRSSWSLPGESAGPVALSHDGRRFAVGLPGAIRLYRLADAKAVLTFAGFSGNPTLLSFSPDGGQLISGMDDTSSLVWQRPSSIDQPARRLESETIRRLWDDLASEDAVRAYQAILRLAESPAGVVSFLDKHLQSVAVPDPKRIVQLIKDLDDNRFTVRGTAEEELEKLGELAESNLKRALSGKPSLEVRRRIEQLLHKLREPIRTPRLLQSIRALEVLEDIGTPEARRLLQELAKGAPEARLTRDAKESLRRLDSPSSSGR